MLFDWESSPPPTIQDDGWVVCESGYCDDGDFECQMVCARASGAIRRGLPFIVPFSANEADPPYSLGCSYTNLGCRDPACFFPSYLSRVQEWRNSLPPH